MPTRHPDPLFFALPAPGFPAFLCAILVLLLLANCLPSEATSPGTPGPTPSKFRDPEDGWFDLSGFMDESYGFAPIVMPITEPALGYGVAGAIVFIDKQKLEGDAGYAQPNLTAVGGLATENGSRGLFGLDSRNWMDDRLQTIVALGSMNIHLDYYGLGEDAWFRDHPVPYELSPVGGRAKVRYRLGDSRAKVGLAYSLASIRIESDPGDSTSVVPSADGDSWLGGLTPSLGYDSRNNIFTPTRGIYAETSCSFFSKALGGDTDHQRAELVALGYLPLHPRATVGARGSVSLSFGDAPYYMRPFVYMRGIEAMRYQGEQIAQMEGELSYQFWKRFSVVGFGGVGWAWSSPNGEESRKSVEALGTGIRYEIARKYGLHMGLDVAWGPDAPAIYVQFGNAWLRL